MSRLLALLSVLLLVTACAQSALTWQSANEFQPLPPDAEVQLFVRASAAQSLREALLEHGAEEVAAFPEGDRVAEIGVREADWLTWDSVLENLRTSARELGADRAVATATASTGPGDRVVYFQLVRSFRRGGD